MASSIDVPKGNPANKLFYSYLYHAESYRRLFELRMKVKQEVTLGLRGPWTKLNEDFIGLCGKQISFGSSEGVRTAMSTFEAN